MSAGGALQGCRLPGSTIERPIVCSAIPGSDHSMAGAANPVAPVALTKTMKVSFALLVMPLVDSLVKWVLSEYKPAAAEAADQAAAGNTSAFVTAGTPSW